VEGQAVAQPPVVQKLPVRRQPLTRPSMQPVPHRLNALLMLALPLALGALLARRLRVPWGLFVAGAGGLEAIALG
jgi:hypothetical protein